MFNDDQDTALRLRPTPSAAPGDNYDWGDEPEPDYKGHKLDEFPATHLHNTLMGHYRRELEIQHDARMQMAVDEDIYDHKHWSENDIAQLEARGQVPLVFNVIFTSVNWVLGSQRQQAMDYKILPRRKEGSSEAERKTELMKYLSDTNYRVMHETRAFAEVVKAGLSWLETGVQDPEDGREPVYERHESWRNILHDSAAQEWDCSDGRYIFRTRWVDLDRAIAMFPDREEVLRKSVQTVYESSVGTDSTGDMAMDSIEAHAQSGYGTSAGEDIGIRQRVRLIEAWYRKPEPTDLIRGGDFTGEIFDPWSKGHIAEIASGRATVVNKIKERVRVAIMSDAGILIDQASPYRHNRFPFTPIWGYRKASDGTAYGMIRGIRDINLDINKRAAKSLWHLSAQQVFVEEGAVDDIEELRAEAGRPDAVITYKPGRAAPVINRDLNLSAAHEAAMARNIQMIQQTSGVTDENMGRTTNATSGRAILARQEQGMMTTNVFFENLRFARRIHGEKMLCNVEQFFTEAKSFRITNKRGNPEYVSINASDEDAITMTKADFIVAEEDYRATARQHAVDRLVELVGILAPANPQFAMGLADLLVEAMDVPRHEEIVKRIRQITKIPDPDADPDNPDEETIALNNEKAMASQFAAMMAKAELDEKTGKAAEAQARAQKAMSDAKVSEAKVDEMFVASMRNAVATAIDLLGVPNSASVADRIMATAIQNRALQAQPTTPQPTPDQGLMQ